MTSQHAVLSVSWAWSLTAQPGLCYLLMPFLIEPAADWPGHGVGASGARKGTARSRAEVMDSGAGWAPL